MKYLVIVLCLMLSGCLFDPFIDVRGEAGTKNKVGRSTMNKPVVCYNSWFTDAKDVASLAERECQETKRHAYLIGQERFSCRIFIPVRAIFECR